MTREEAYYPVAKALCEDRIVVAIPGTKGGEPAVSILSWEYVEEQDRGYADSADNMERAAFLIGAVAVGRDRARRAGVEPLV